MFDINSELHSPVNEETKILAAELAETMRSPQYLGNRYILGITGAPGSGKSTLAQSLVDEINETQMAEEQPAVLVPMDGYHRSNEDLAECGLLDLKGIPDTFDAESFVSALAEIRTNHATAVFLPAFDRSQERSVPSAIVVEPKHRLVIVEGNYLLLEKEPWDNVLPLLDCVWHIEASEEIILPRLIDRHMKGGKTREQAMRKVETTDLRNALLVERSKHNASRIIELKGNLSRV